VDGFLCIGSLVLFRQVTQVLAGILVKAESVPVILPGVRRRKLTTHQFTRVPDEPRHPPRGWSREMIAGYAAGNRDPVITWG
jgi:hypothetical protein